MLALYNWEGGGREGAKVEQAKNRNQRLGIKV